MEEIRLLRLRVAELERGVGSHIGVDPPVARGRSGDVALHPGNYVPGLDATNGLDALETVRSHPTTNDSGNSGDRGKTDGVVDTEQVEDAGKHDDHLLSSCADQGSHHP